MYELDTVYGVEDVYDFLEILIVDARNQKILSKIKTE